MNETILKNKIMVLENDINRLNAMVIQANFSASEAQKEANYHIGAMQSRYDTFKEEAQYLAEAQKLRVITLKSKISQSQDLIKKLQFSKANTTDGFVDLGSIVLIQIEDEKDEVCYFFVPDGTGQIVNIENYQVVCVNPEAPIAKFIIGLQVNDEVEVLFRGKKKLGIIIDLF
jgi:transcription elongation GreA/GreB family factor